MKMSNRKVICFDFDGVLASYDEWKDGEIGKPLIGGITLAQLCDSKGYKIVVNTCRTHPKHGGRSAQKEQYIKIAKWLYENNVPFDYIEMYGKPVADVYVDDRGLYFNQEFGDNVEYANSLFYRIVLRCEK